MVTVTEEQIGALRAQLIGDFDGYRRTLADLDSRGALAGYTALITAAFIEAVDLRFGPDQRDDAAVVRFIGDIRSRFPGTDNEIDPAAAERVVRKALGRGSISDMSGAVIRHTERLLLPLIVAELELDPEDVDRLLAGARKLLDT
jgi:hypothetical protein